MHRRFLFLTVSVLLTNCIHDLQNPSDPSADHYSIDSKAVIRSIGSGDIKAGDTARFWGGVTSREVMDRNLVTRCAWDFDNDGNVDTVTDGPDTVEFVFNKAGTWRCVLKCTDKARFTDTATLTIRVWPRFWGFTLTIVVRTGDTLRVTIDSENPIPVVSASGDTITVIPYLSSDSIAIVKLPGDTVGIPLVNADTIALTSSRIDTIEPPDLPLYLPEFPAIAGFPENTGGSCSFFAADSALMHTNLQFYDIMWEKTRSDGLEALEFVEKLIADIAGYSIVTLLGNDYSYSFDNGVYAFHSDDFAISCAFHYGSGIGSHAENDTVRSDLFSLGSYIGGLKTTLTPPFYTFSRGPLFDLIDGDLSVDASLHVSFSVNFSRLKISFSRKTVTDFTSLPFFVVNDSLQLQITHTSYARMAPLYMLEFAGRFHDDSIMLDHSGTSMESAPAPLEVIFKTEETWQKATYAFAVKQTMDAQQTAYGNRDGVLKLSGTYSTTAMLGFDGYEQAVWFSGRYSSIEHDSSRFYCDREKTDEFGTLFFGAVADSVGSFTSEKFGYAFEYLPPAVVLENFINH